MKLPGSVGQKKAKAIEQVLDELGIGKICVVLSCIHSYYWYSWPRCKICFELFLSKYLELDVLYFVIFIIPLHRIKYFGH